MVKAIARVATELAKRKARSAGKFPKGKKGSKAVDARTSRYIKTPSGMKLNPERFKQKPLPKTKKLKKPTTPAERKKFFEGATAGATTTFLGMKGSQIAKDKKTKKTKQMADEAYKKQKKRQKEYRQKKGGKGNR